MKSNPDNLYFIVGLGATILSALSRSIKALDVFTVQGLIRAVCDAVVCSLFSSGIILSLHEYYDISFVYSIGIGTLVGSLGSTYIIEVANNLIKRYLGLGKDDENK